MPPQQRLDEHYRQRFFEYQKRHQQHVLRRQFERKLLKQRFSHELKRQLAREHRRKAYLATLKNSIAMQTQTVTDLDLALLSPAVAQQMQIVSPKDDLEDFAWPNDEFDGGDDDFTMGDDMFQFLDSLENDDDMGWLKDFAKIDQDVQSAAQLPVAAPANSSKRRAPEASGSSDAAYMALADEAPRKSVRIEAPRGSRGGTAPQRTVPWRRVGSMDNERMRAAIWVYRFAPAVKSKTVQSHFKVSVKTLMRYVYDSCLPEYDAYGLYFGPAGQGVAGMADRAVEKKHGRVKAAAIGYVPDFTAPGVPALARDFAN